MSWRRRRGDRGEESAARHLRKHGFAIVARNFATRRGEIDIIAERGGTIVFVEVRLRKEGPCGTPAETVGHAKRRRIVKAAAAYLARLGRTDAPCRFDVIALQEDTHGSISLVHYENAFGGDGRVTGAWSNG